MALGVIETLGVVALLEAADAMLKAADVEVAKYMTAGGGISMCVMQGELSALRAAVEAGAAAAQRVGGLTCHFVLASPSQAVMTFLNI